MQNRCQSGAAAASTAAGVHMCGRLAWGNSCNMQQQHLPLCATVANVTCATTSCAAATLQRAPLLLFRATSDAAHSKRSASQVPQKSGYTVQQTHTHPHTYAGTERYTQPGKFANKQENNSNSDSDRATATPTAKPVQATETTKTRAKLAQKVDKRRVAKRTQRLDQAPLQSKEGQTWRRDALSLSSCGCRLHQSPSQQQPQWFL